MKAERVVVDTNALISALLLPSSKPADVIRRIAESRASLLLSRVTYLELASRLARPKFDRYRSVAQMNRYLDWLADLAEWLKPSIRISDCPDPDDNRFLEVLIAGDGDVLITDDTDLLDLNPYEGRPIISPATFWRCWRSTPRSR